LIVAKTQEFGMGAGVEASEDILAGPEPGAWDREDFLAHARLILAVVCTIAVYLSTAYLGRNGNLIRLLILVYLTFSLFNLIIVRIHRHYGWAWGLCHASEVVITSLITMFTGGAQSPFLGLYLFLLLAAACKWGFKGALLTSCVCIAILFSDLTVLSSWSGRAPQMNGGISLVALMTLSASLISSACLLGLLMEREKKRYGDAMVITQTIRSAVPEPSFRTSIGNILRSVRGHFDADQVRLAIQEIRGEEAVAWEVTRLPGKNGDVVQSWKLTESARRASIAMPPEEVRRWLRLDHVAAGDRLRESAARNHKRGTHGTWLSRLWGSSAPTKYCDGLYDLRIVNEQHSSFGVSWSLLATSFSIEGKWLGRLTVYNPHRGRDPDADLRILGTLVREVGPAVYGKYLVARLRSRAQSMERVRLVQELHDGIIQSLIGLEMRIDLLRRTQTASSDPSALLQELQHLQTLFHNEIAALRDEMQRIKPLEVEPCRLTEYMAGTVDRFAREQGISASFVAECQEVSLPPRVCTELVRIVQEALANVRKHSGARNVFVRFARENGHYKLSVEDDGRGFGFTGRLSSSELEASSSCPLVVKERVRAIGGELMIESSEGLGARIGISIPLTANGRISSDN
jgi:signal transduction histidine kinase